MFRCKTNFCTFYDKKVCCCFCPRQDKCAFKCGQFFETCGKAIKDAGIAFVPKEIPKTPKYKYRRKKYVRKSYPKDKNWDKVVKIYCSKDKKSFAKIPKDYQPLMQQLLGKVIGEFVCDKIKEITADNLVAIYFNNPQENTCLNDLEMRKYADGKNLFLWHISDLVIYDKPKELSEFSSGSSRLEFSDTEDGFPLKWSGMTRPPQSWCYVEELR